MTLFPNCSLSLDCGFRFEAMCITARTAGDFNQGGRKDSWVKAKGKAAHAFTQRRLWQQLETLIWDHRLHSATGPKRNSEGFCPSLGSRTARVLHWPRCTHAGVNTGRKWEESRQPAAAWKVLCTSRGKALWATGLVAILGLQILSRETLCWCLLPLWSRRVRGRGGGKDFCVHFSWWNRTEPRKYPT